MEWSDFFDLGGHSIPRHTRLYRGSSLEGQAEVTEATVLPSVDPGNFSRPDGSEEWAECQNPIVPPLLERPEPAYTPDARTRKVTGTVTLYLRLDRAGKIEVVSVLSPLDPGLDENALEIVKNKWKFKPVTCEGTPIPMELRVEVTFKLF
jgi:TonB family protein